MGNLINNVHHSMPLADKWQRVEGLGAVRMDRIRTGASPERNLGLWAARRHRLRPSRLSAAEWTHRKIAQADGGA